MFLYYIVNGIITPGLTGGILGGPVTGKPCTSFKDTAVVPRYNDDHTFLQGISVSRFGLGFYVSFRTDTISVIYNTHSDPVPANRDEINRIRGVIDSELRDEVAMREFTNLLRREKLL